MRPRVYVETTVVSYLTARPARDVVVAGRQQSTRDWWSNAATRFELVASELVFNEAAEGDAEAARDRLDVLSTATPLDATREALALAQRLVDEGAVPAMAAEDAAHIAIAVANGIEYLVTWNYRHIANAASRSRIEAVCRNEGFEPVIICSPDELMEYDHDTG
jgi:hypothetical protein